MLGEIAGFDEGSIAVRAGEGFDSVVSSLGESKRKEKGQRGTRRERRGRERFDEPYESSTKQRE